MDNVTHSLIGVLLGEMLAPTKGSRRSTIQAAVIGSNLPDIDLVLRPLFTDPTLGYLVYHRGHTHTFAAALPLAMAAVVAVARLDRHASPQRLRLLGVALAAVTLHIGADWWNNYGVHPFWPLDNHWYYGDLIFIVEPLIWTGLIPFALFSTSSRLLKGVWGLLFTAMLALVWMFEGIPLATALFVTGWAGIFLAVQRRWRSRGPPVVALGLVLALFGVGSWQAERRVRAELEARAPGERVVDIVRTPSPGTPWCWQVIALSFSRPETAGTGGEVYFARQAAVSLLPGVSPPAACEAALRGGGGRTAPPVADPLPSSHHIRWKAGFEGPVAELRSYARDSCRVAALLRFARAPFWKRDGDQLIAGDLRYDFEPGLGFAEIRIRLDDPALEACNLLAPWIPDAAREFLPPAP